MCLKNAALHWHISLSAKVRAEMNNDLKIWKNELLKKYRSNKFETLKKTEKMKFRFDDSFILNEYLSKKINHFHDTSIFDQNTMIRYFWNEFDIQFILTTSFRENEDTLKNFERRVRVNEQTVKRIHDQKNRFESFQSFRSNRYDKKSSWKKNISTKRVQKLIDKLFFKKNTIWTRIKKIETKKIKKSLNVVDFNLRFKIISFRLCKHCERKHWNADCDKSDRIKKILTNIVDDDENDQNTILNDENVATYETLQAAATEMTNSENSKIKS